MRLKMKKLTAEFPYLILILPALAIFTVGMLIPLCLGIYYSMTDWNGLDMQKNFIGLANYAEVFKEGRFYDALYFTLKFTIWNTVIQNILALLFAMALNSQIKAKKTLRTIIFIPVLFSPILVGFLWSNMFSDVLPALGKMLHINYDFGLFGDPDKILGGLLIANNWQWIGYWMIIYLAGLQAVPKDLYEACTMDGGSPLHKFLHITLPLIAPAITINVIAITSGSIRVYDLIVTATNGGPGHASESLVLFVYNLLFQRQQASLGSALSVIMMLALLIIAFVQMYFLRKREVQM